MDFSRSYGTRALGMILKGLLLGMLWTRGFGLNPPVVIVEPDHPDWTYAAGESMRFHVRVVTDEKFAGKLRATYMIGSDGFPAERKEIEIGTEGIVLEAGLASEPGFIRCTVETSVEGQLIRGTAAAAVDPGKIVATQSDPADFAAFWDKIRRELREIPLATSVEPMACDDPKVRRYRVSFQNLAQPGSDRPTRIYGVLCVPNKPGRFPAVVRYPGAGVRGYAGWLAPAREGVITLEIGVHGIPIDLDPSVYEELRFGPLFGNNVFNLDDPERYYYRRIYAGCLRAVDFIASLEQFDGENYGVTGGSQGGLLALVVATLDSRIKALVCMMPAYCDVTADLHGQAGGWPRMFFPGSAFRTSITEEKIRTTGYYDAVNFARRLTVPAFFGWGFNDEICSPRSLYAGYNAVKSPKILQLDLPAGHEVQAGLDGAAMQWLFAHLKPEVRN